MGKSINLLIIPLACDHGIRIRIHNNIDVLCLQLIVKLLLAGMINNVSVLIQNKHVSLVTNAVLVTQLTDGAVIQVNKYHTVTVPCAVEIMDLPA